VKITPRLRFSLLLLTALLLARTTQAAEIPPAAQKYFVYVGSYTAKTDSKGIYLFEFATDTGKLIEKGLAAETADPSWVAIDPSGKVLFAANESGKASTISAFSIERKTGKLSLLNKLPAHGEDPCYLSFDKTGKYLLVANYSSGNIVVFPILPDGKLGEKSATAKDAGSVGPNKERQDGPHAHWVELAKQNDFAYVADLGLDRILVYRFDAAQGAIAPLYPSGDIPPDAATGSEPLSVGLAPASGPRHVVFSSDDKFMYVLGELSSTVSVFAKLGGGRFRPIQEISALPKEFTGRNDAAEIAILPNGKFLYASNRGQDAIAVFSIDPAKGTLTQIEDVPTGGKEPRNFVIDPTGQFLLAENQNSNTIVEFKIDPSTGKLTPTGEIVKTPSPICIAFLPEP